MAKILVVDDEKIISSSLSRVLVRKDHEVSIANNGIEAISMMEKMDQIDFIFMDLLMPEIGGGEVLDHAKKRHPEVIVFMMTAYGDQAVKDDLIRRGAERVLSKPFDDITKIPDLISEYLNKRNEL